MNELIKIDLNGPEGAGLTRMELSQEEPIQHFHQFYRSPDEGLVVGVWDTTDMQERFGPYFMDEFIIVFEGEFDLVGAKGLAARCRAGQAAFVHAGSPVSWLQKGYLRKIYVTLRPKDAPASALPEPKVAVINPSDAGSKTSNDGFDIDDRLLAASSDGRMQAWKIDSGARMHPATTSPGHQLLHVTAGSLELSSSSEKLHVQPGETVSIPSSTRYAWTVTDSLKAYRLTIRP